MAYDVDDTIVAIASADAGGAVGIVRVSGPEAIACVIRSWWPNNADSPSLTKLRTPHRLVGCWELADSTGKVPPRRLPCQLLVWPTRRSYTRQPIVEIHMPGSPALTSLVMQQICAAGARMAKPGEFTLRAFLAGRLDLAQAEAVLGVIDATSSPQLSTALSQLAGGLSGPLGAVRDALLNVLADVEAGLDFVDEDIEFITDQQVIAVLQQAEVSLARIRQQIRDRHEQAATTRVVLRGRPNVGKSTLWNALVGEVAALVSDVPGTTRDYLEAPIELRPGWFVALVDSAGVDQDLSSAIDRQSQDLGGRLAEQADLTVLCLDGTQAVQRWEVDRLRDAIREKGVVALTKADKTVQPLLDSLPDDLQLARIDASDAYDSSLQGPDWGGQLVAGSSNANVYRLSESGSNTADACFLVPVSAIDHLGLIQLSRQIERRLVEAPCADISIIGTTASRCLTCIDRALESSQRAMHLAEMRTGHELVAAEIREILQAMAEVIGEVYTDDILDRVFSRFCIGK